MGSKETRELLKRNIDKRRPWRGWYQTKQWKALRAAQLRKQPLCAFHLHQGKKVKADTVDHKRAHKGNETAFYNPANLQSLCAHCHNAIKQSHERGRFKPVGVNGFPL